MIRDGDKPPVGHWSYSRQYDTYSGGLMATEDWVGYQYGTDFLFGQVVFQEGINPGDGGFFDAVTVQVRQGGSWVQAPGLTVTPQYLGDDGVAYDTYVFGLRPRSSATRSGFTACPAGRRTSSRSPSSKCTLPPRRRSAEMVDPTLVRNAMMVTC